LAAAGSSASTRSTRPDRQFRQPLGQLDDRQWAALATAVQNLVEHGRGCAVLTHGNGRTVLVSCRHPTIPASARSRVTRSGSSARTPVHIPGGGLPVQRAPHVARAIAYSLGRRLTWGYVDARGGVGQVRPCGDHGVAAKLACGYAFRVDRTWQSQNHVSPVQGPVVAVRPVRKRVLAVSGG
jgi:hypothetical protein